MLLWIRAEAQARGIRAVIVSAGRVRAEQDLVAKLSERRRWIDRLGSILWMGLQRSSPAGQTQTLEEALGRQVRQVPLALLIDEAHILDVRVGLNLLSTVQELRGQGAPLFMVLAGTPGLPERLDAMQATFWERSEILPFERLQARDAGDAIRVPFEVAERTIGSDALGRAVAESHGYPFFLQIWGKSLWGSEDFARATVKSDDIRRAGREFAVRRDRFYGLRYDELKRMGLVGVAVALADAYSSKPQLHGSEIDDVLETALRRAGRPSDTESVAEILSRLVSVGYLWNPGVGLGDRYVGGIPSLMDFVRESARPD